MPLRRPPRHPRHPPPHPRFAAFSFFLPSLVAGPIKRHPPCLASLDADPACVTVNDVNAGALRVATGFVRKVVLADNPTAAIAYGQPPFAGLPLAARWFFCAAHGLRILLAQMAGIRLPENFRWPCAATSGPDLWQRRHLALSTWIRNGVSIPLGGNRHGAGPALRTTSRPLLGAPGRRLGTALDRLPRLAWALTMLFVFVGWLYFFYPVPAATHMLRLLFTP